MKFFWEVFVTLFVVIDPPGTVPIFLGLTSGRTAKERNRLAWQAALVAVGVILWLFLRYCDLVVRILRPSGVELLTRVSGLLVSAIAVQLIAGSVEAFVRGAH